MPLWITEGARKVDSAISRGACCIGVLGVYGWRGRNANGGLVALADWEAVAPNGRTVYLAFDSDAVTKREVVVALARFARFLSSRGALVAIVRLPQGEAGVKVGLDDYLAAGHSLDDAAALASPEIATARPAEDATRRSIVVSGRHLRDVTADALRALDEENDPPALFRRAGALARACRTERGQSVIEQVGEGELRGMLARAANFVRETGAPVPPPVDVVADILALGEWIFPPLESIVETPILRADGSVLDAPGYDQATRLLYVPAYGLGVPAVPASPTRAHVDAAVAMLDETIGDFPFVDEASEANAAALLLTPLLRPAIDGAVPLALVDKPAPGTGASLLADAVALVATGRRAAMTGAPRDEEEWRKLITSTLLRGASVVVFDNVDRPLASGSLSRAITAGDWADRVLGRSETVTLPQRAVWIATGNNLRLRGDLARRSYWIRMNAQVAEPWRRTEFRHPDLLSWIAAHRGEILAALLTLARAWFAAGRPRGDAPHLSGFEAWARALGGVLHVAGIPGFLANLDGLYALVDDEAPAWAAFLAAWHDVLGEDPVTVAGLLDMAQASQTLREAVPEDLELDGDGKRIRQRWGLALRRRADTVYGEGAGALRLTRVDDRHAKVARWRVIAGTCGDSFNSFAGTRRRDSSKRSAGENEAANSPQVPALPATDIVDIQEAGSGSEPELDSLEDDGRRTWILALGEARGWPSLSLGPGRSIVEGERYWRIFAARASDEDLAAAITALIRTDTSARGPQT